MVVPVLGIVSLYNQQQQKEMQKVNRKKNLFEKYFRNNISYNDDKQKYSLLVNLIKFIINHSFIHWMNDNGKTIWV